MKKLPVIQIQQTIILLIILVVGIYFYGLYITFYEVLLVFLTVFLTDFFARWFIEWKKQIPFSWINAAFWICFFLRTDETILFVFAWIIAILSKYIFITREWKHFFNPSNFWVFITLILFSDYAWINSLQWWNYTWWFSWGYLLSLLFVCLGWIFMYSRVFKKFKYNYALELALPVILLQSILFFIIPMWETLTSYFQFFSVSFFIFIFFMITDPHTMPHTRKWRIFHSILIVLFFYLLQFFINESYSILWGLFLATLLLPFVWKYEEVKVNSFFSVSDLIYLCFVLLISILVVVLLYLYGRPDFVFDNVCSNLFCK